MAHFYLIHGFNEKAEGLNTVNTLREGLERRGHTAVLIRYGWFGRIRSRFCNKGVAKVVASTVIPGSHVIAFSNGAAITYYAAKYGAPWDRVFLINPALNRKTAIPNVRKVDVMYSKSDPWTKLARYIPISIWGSQGAVGYKGKDEGGRYTHVELDALCGFETRHGGVFGSFLCRERVLNAIQSSLDKDQ